VFSWCLAEKGNVMSLKGFSCAGGVAAALAVTLAAPAARANSNAIRYRYVPLDQAAVPAPYVANNFLPAAVHHGVVVGTIFDATFSTEAVAVWQNGTLTIGPAGFANAASAVGLIGGFNSSFQAALFFGNQTTLVPRLPGEVSSQVNAVGLVGLSLVQSTNASFVNTYAYYLAGAESVIDFGVPNPVFGGSMNDLGFVAVTEEESSADHFTHGVRYNPITKTSTLLPPFAGDPTDVLVLVQGINDRNEVLGYSYTNTFGATYHERVGLWNASGVFQTYFFETLNTDMLVFNNLDQIVITNSLFAGQGFGTSYLVPQPGTRLDLDGLVVNLPAGLSLDNVAGIDDQGNITGIAGDATYANTFPFLLVPLADGETCGDVEVHGCQIPAAVLQILQKSLSHK
jgi:hypothetical protein